MKMRFFISAVLTALVSTTAIADTSSMSTTTTGMGVLENEWVKAGVNSNTGTLGSGGSTSPGLLFDPTGTGTFNPSYDYLTPGSPFDGFAVKVDGTNYNNNNTGSIGITKNTTDGFVDGTDIFTWSGGVSSVFNIENRYTLEDNKPYIDIRTTIGMLVDADSVSFAKYIDPDSQGMPGDSSSTDNVLGYGIIPITNVAFSEATTSRYALGIYTTDTNVTAGIERWTQEADGYSGTNYRDSEGNEITYGNSDDTIGISWTWTGITTGDILEANYAYIFGPSAFDAAEGAITGGAGGGNTTTTSSWGTLTDVGSATDAAESGATGSSGPTLVSTTTDTITSTSEAISSTLPILTASVIHHEASDDGKIQTIEREKTTSVTTPMEVTTTSFDRTTETYDDGSTVVTDGDTTSTTTIRNDTVTTVTDPGSFFGRVDQLATAQNVITSNMRNLNFNSVKGFRMDSKYANGMKGTTAGMVVGGSVVDDNGVTLGIGGARISTDLSGNEDTSRSTTSILALSAATEVEENDIALNIRHAITDYTTSRTIGDFTNSGETQGTTTSINMSISPDTGKVRPVFGYTRVNTSIDGYTETGDVQSARTLAKIDDSYGYATVGLKGTLGMFDVSLMHHTDGVDDIALGIEDSKEDITWRLQALRSMNDLGDTNSISASISLKF